MRIHPPYDAYTYFREKRPLDSIEALIDLSTLAYSSEDFIHDTLSAAGITHTVIKAPDLQAIIATEGDVTVVAFRGTEGLDDWKIDLEVKKNEVGLHEGFANSSSSLLPFVLPLVRGKSVILTGHSLGAAISAVTAIRLRMMCQVKVVNFGQPRIGDKYAIQLLNGLTWTRYVHGCDIVPTVPPEDLGFMHGGIEIDIPQTPYPTLGVWSTEKPFYIPKVGWSHIPTLYANFLWKNPTFAG